MILINSQYEIEQMRKACKLASELLIYLENFVKPGISTLELNDLAEEWTLKRGARSGPLGYRGFPKSICTSINHVICHGIPSSKDIIKDGDIINIDVTPVLNGFYGDKSKTYCVGNPIKEKLDLVKTTELALEKAIKIIKPGIPIFKIGETIESAVKGTGYSIVDEFVGHGVGRIFHTAPTVYHCKNTQYNITLKEGMIFTIEPMLNAGSKASKILDDGWTAVTVDGKDSAQFEHTVLVTESGVEILTL